MKKILFLAAMLLGVVSCQRDQEGFDVAVGGEQETVITLSLPEVTRSMSNTGFDFEDFANNTDYDLRFILEIHHGDKVVRDVQTSKNGTSATFSVRLVAGREYTFVAWADLVDEDTNTDLYYNTANGLDEITLKEWTPMTEARDAYTCTVTEEFNPQTGVTMELKRPFAKVRVVSTDIQKVIDLGIEPTKAVVDYTSDLYTSYNAVLGAVAGTAAPKNHTFNYADVDSYTDNTGEKTMFTDYILVPKGEGETVIFSIDIQDATGTIKKTEFNSAIPVEVNKLTTLRGAVLTEGGKVSITVDGELGEKETINIVGTASDLQQAINAIEVGEEGNIQLGGDISLNDLLSAGILSTRAATRDYIYIAEDKTVVLDLNGFNISHSDVENKYAFNNHGTFIIKDSKGGGSINARGIYNGYGEGAENVATAKIIVESGVINAKGTNGGAAIYNYGVVEVKGGKFESNGGYGLNNQSGASITITGGEIRGGIYNLGTLSVDGENTSVYQHLSGKHAIYNYAATAIINNGAFDSESGNELILADGENSSVTINGGTFDKTAKSWLMGAATGKNITFVVNGGTFRGYVNMPEMTVDTFRPYGDPIVVYGGNFNFNPANFVAEGYGATEDNGIWTVAKSYDITEEGYTILTAPGMFWFANEVNSGANYFEGKTIKLGADIDLNNAEWTPIGSAYKDHGFMGNFDGNGKTIKNLKITALTPDADQYVYGGLFGVTEGVDKNNQNYIKNLTIENVTIDLNGHIVAAAIAYPYYTALENITVKGNVSIKGGNYTSGVLAYTRRCVDAKNISIEANAGSVIEGNITIGGVISDIQTNGGLKANYSNFKAENLTIKGTQSVGGISGIIGAQNLDGAIVKNVTIVSDDIRTGMISGSFDGHSVITNAVVENVTGADYYIGYLYSSTEGDRSSVTINGDKYTYNNGWIINGCKIIADGVILNETGEYIISNAAGMFWFANEVNVNKNAFNGKTVKLANDIDLQNAVWTPVGQTGATTFNGVFDGDNYTIFNLNVNSEAQTGAHYSSGLFGWVESHTAGHGHLKNVKINGATINGHHNCGALVGYITQETALVENCHVTGATVTCTKANDDADGDKAGALIGNATVATPVKDCTATNSTVSAGRDAGQVIGAGKEANVTGCSATNVAVSANETSTGKNIRNEVIGRLL